MQLLEASGEWRDGFLDQAIPPGAHRVEVVVQLALFPADAQFFVRRRDPRMLLAYLRAFGPTQVLRKVRSRQSEVTRNDAWLSVGVGWAELEGTRTAVAFVASSGPRGVERINVARPLLRPLDVGSAEGPPRHLVAPSPAAVHRVLGAAAVELEELVGWQPEEGTVPSLTDDTWAAVAKLAAQPSPGWVEAPPRLPATPVRERAEGLPVVDRRRSYHVFGYGQYAKVNATANLDRRLVLAGIHEINPAQLGPASGEPGPALDTSPMPRPDEDIVNAVVAGYHHTHVPTAVALIEQGARHVIVEKPIATTAEQVDALLDVLDRFPAARVHCAYQRSHSPFNGHLRADLGTGPVSMAATVYEVPLPPRHWYRWPVVGNAVVSNGCHWIDYFLHVNGYPETTALHVMVLATQTVLTLELHNGASGTISLRHQGSPRLGVRDLIQFWSDEATATIEDNSRYRSERGYRVLRSVSVPRARATEEMYREFARRIELDLPGDDPRAIRVSARAVVELARLVDEARAARADVDPR
ncbi:MAG TPA: Gfo/Idh/MocA family oxidoreductase [Acidimicrobiales bacterium]|nr:Gfo/Idh/MocA family oxidoreductase [Acidimicrobiales bacterium]